MHFPPLLLTSPSSFLSFSFFFPSGSGGRKVRQHPSAGGGGIGGVWDDLGCSGGGGAGHTHPGRVVLQGWKLGATRILPQTQSPNAQELPELCESRASVALSHTNRRLPLFVSLIFVWNELNSACRKKKSSCSLRLMSELCLFKCFTSLQISLKSHLKNLLATFILNKTSKVCL